MANTQHLSLETEGFLIRKRAALMENIKLSRDLWTALVKHNVLLEAEAEKIQGKGDSSDTQQISDLVAHLLKGPRTRHEGFLRALVEAGQGHVVTDILQEAVQCKPQEHGQKTQLDLDKQRLLREKAQALKKYIAMNELFWERLMKNHVLSHFEVEMFQDDNALPANQIHDLIEYLKSGTNKTYRGFLYALSETGQKHIVTDILEETVPDRTPEALSAREDSETMLTTEMKELLKQKAPELIEKVKPTDELWASLVKHKVISDVTKDDIKTGEREHSGQISELLTYIRTVGHYNGFVCSLIEAHQKDVVIAILGEDTTGYLKAAGPNIAHPILRDAVENMKKTYLRKFQSTTLDFSDECLDLQNLYTPLLITKTGIKRQPKIVVSEDFILDNDADRTVQALCVGEAGCGKTTLSKRLAMLWANGKQTSPFWSTTKMVVFVTSENEDNNFQQTLRNSIPGKKAYKDLAMDLMKDDPESVLVIIEAFEEFQNDLVIEGTKQMIRDGATNVFLTVRKDHPCITAKFSSLFNHHYQIDGFIPERAENFIQRFLADIKCQYNIQEFLQAINGKPQFETNPLNLTLVCQLYAEGQLKSSDMDTLTEVKLYAMRESRMVERECEKQEVSTEDIPSEIQKVQSLALYCLFKRNHHCTKSDLEHFNIKQESFILILLKKIITSSAEHGKQEHWTWPHSRLLEFDAVTALSKVDDLQNSLWLYWIANRPEFNEAAQLLAAILGTSGNFGAVKSLTEFSIILQSKAKCMMSMDQPTMASHACHIVTTSKNTIESTMTVETCFTGGKHMPLKSHVDIPDLGTLIKCCGSLYSNNVSLFLHVQECWRLGLKEAADDGFVSSCNDLLLPGVDRSNDQEFHFMLKEPGDLGETFDKLEPNCISKVEIHLGLCLGESLFNMTEQWTHCLTSILRPFQPFQLQPFIIHVNHNGNNSDLSEVTKDALNGRGILVHPQKNAKWIILPSDINSRNSQIFVPATTRSAILSMTKDDELTVEVHRIHDVLKIPRGHEFTRVSEFVVNVGFPSTTMYHGPQPDEPPEVWQDAILYMLNTWGKDAEILIRSGNPQEMKHVISDKCLEILRDTKLVDVIYDPHVKLVKMLNCCVYQTGGAPVYIYTRRNGDICIRVRLLSDICLVDPSKVTLGNEREVLCIVQSLDTSSQEPSIEEELKKAAEHVLFQLHATKIKFKWENSGPDLSFEVVQEFILWAFEKKMLVDAEKNIVRIRRADKGFRHVKDDKSGRSILVYKAVDGNAEIWASQPSDCKLLQRGHIETASSDELTVRFDQPFMYNLNNDANPDSGEDWQDAIKHLLSTFQPRWVNMFFGKLRLGMQKEFTLDVTDGDTYTGLLTRNQEILYLFRNDKGFLQVKNPSNDRSILVLEAFDTVAEISASQPSDCKLLHRGNIQCDSIDELTVRFNQGFMCKINGRALPETLEDWQDAIKHILCTYQPKRVSMSFGDVRPGIQQKFTVNVSDDVTYTGLLHRDTDILYLYR